MIDFWSTTCDPCMAEMPHIVQLYKKHKDKGFVVLAISLVFYVYRHVVQDKTGIRLREEVPDVPPAPAQPTATVPV